MSLVYFGDTISLVLRTPPKCVPSGPSWLVPGQTPVGLLLLPAQCSSPHTVGFFASCSGHVPRWINRAIPARECLHPPSPTAYGWGLSLGTARMLFRLSPGPASPYLKKNPSCPLAIVTSSSLSKVIRAQHSRKCRYLQPRVGGWKYRWE